MKHTALLMACGMISVLVVAGCGGGTPAATPTSKAAPSATAASAVPATATAATGAASPTVVRTTPTPQPTASPTSAATAQKSTPAPTTGQRMRVAVGSFGNEQMDPAKGLTTVLGVIGGPVYDWLVWYAPDGSLVPGLAASWQMSPDGMTWTINMRQARFHNGDPVTGDDVKFSLERVLLPSATSTDAPSFRDSLASIEVTSPGTVLLHMKKVWPLLPYALAPIEGTSGAVLPHTYFQSVGERPYFDKPVGTGPWQLTKRETGVQFSYKANEAAHPFRKSPAFKELDLALLPEQSTRTAALRTGQVNMAEITQETVAAIKDANLKILQIPATRSVGVHFWGVADTRAKDMPLANPKVREALSLAIDRQEIVDILLAGLGEIPARWVVTQGTLGYDPAWKPDSFDPKRAKQLLAEAGFTNGFGMQMYQFAVPGVAWTQRGAEVVAGYWEQIGVKTKLAPIDYGAFTQLYRGRPQPQELLGTASVQSVPISSTNLVYLRANYDSPQLRYSTPEMKGLLDNALAEKNDQQRIDLIRQIAALDYGQHVTIPLANTGSLYAVNQTIKDWTPIRSGYVGMALETVQPG